MKKILTLFLLLPLLSMAQVGVNTTTPKAALDVESTNNGLLIPRVQLTSILDNTTIVNPNLGPLETSTLVYNLAAAGTAPDNVVAGFYYWNNTSSRWIPITASTGWQVDGNDTITTPANPITYGTSPIGSTENFIGTTDANDFTIGTNNIERMRVKNTTGFLGIGTANPSTPLEVASSGINEFRLSSRGAFGASRFSMISDKELATEWRPTYIESADNGSFTGRMDFYTNGTGIANRFGSVRAMSIVNGNVGVGITNPTQKLHAFENADTNKSVILGEARQINTGTDFLNIGVKGNGNGTGGWGFGVGVLGMSDVNNTYNSTGVYALLGTVNPTFSTSFSRNQALIANGNGIGNSAMFVGGNIGIGVPLDTNPTNLVHINNATPGALRIVDGTQGANRVLTSDAAGVATWQNLSPSGFSHYLGELYLGGIIFELYKGSDGLEHGLIVSLTEPSHAWQTTNTLVNANRSEDGAFNTAQMTSSPAASYVSSLGAGWYIPSIDELNILYNNRYYANKALRLGGYTLISRTGSYWSSTENTSNTVFGLFSFTGTFLQLNKSDTFVVRAIRAF